MAQSVLITGCSRGIGLELVRQMALLKPHPEVIVATCRNPEEATALQEIARENSCVTVVRMDVENDDEIDAAVETTRSLVGDKGLNLLINNAGIFLKTADGGSIPVQTRERMAKSFSVNCTSPIIVTQKFLPLLKIAAEARESEPMSLQKAGCVVMTGRMGSQMYTYSNSDKLVCFDYKCSKSAANMAALLLGKTLKEFSILGVGIHPGRVRTDMGGQNVPMSVQESVEAVLGVLTKIEEKFSGLTISYINEPVPF